MTIQLSNDLVQVPILKRSNKYSAIELSQELLNTTYNGYNNSAEPLLMMGLAVMARFRYDFFKENRGFTVAYMHGPTSAGKTNILNNIAYLYGFNEDFISSGDSTILSMWQNLDNYNCIPVIYDEISRKVLGDNHFEGLIKSAYQGTNRDKISKIKTAINSTLIVSSNCPPPQKPEILNRLLLCNFEPRNFNLSKVIEFNDIRENYLSNLLPAIIKYEPGKVMKLYKASKVYIKILGGNLDSRSIGNIAIAYTGYKVLIDIAKKSQPKAVTENLEKFVKNYGQSLKVDSPWEEFINALPQLARDKAIKVGKDYKYAYDRVEQSKNDQDEPSPNPHLLCLHFEQAYRVYVGYYRQMKGEFPPTQKELIEYAKNSPQIHPGKTQVTKGINIGGVKKRCIVIDVLDNYELSVLDKM